MSQIIFFGFQAEVPINKEIIGKFYINRNIARTNPPKYIRDNTFRTTKQISSVGAGGRYWSSPPRQTGEGCQQQQQY